MKVRILKFGGTSVATAEAREAATKQVSSAVSEGVRPVTVVSAIGRKGMPYATDTLIEALRDIDPATPPAERELDLLMACGEILSAVVFSHHLKCVGLRSAVFTGAQAGIITDHFHGDARIRSVDSTSVSDAIAAGVIPVVCGFQGVAQGTGETTTLGRGGSDTTAAALGVALQADRIDIFTDVPGVMSADPRMVANAILLPRISYEEVAELAHLGAKVLHPRAAEIAMRGNVPIQVRSTFSDDPGTTVGSELDIQDRGITGVASSDRMAHVALQGVAASEQANVFKVLARADIPVSLITLTVDSMAFVVPHADFASVRSALDGLVLQGGTTVISLGKDNGFDRAHLQASALGDGAKILTGRVVENCSIVSVIGGRHHQRPGVFKTVLSTLHDLGVRVIQTTDSEFSVGVLVDGADVNRAVVGLHHAFSGDL